MKPDTDTFELVVESRSDEDAPSVRVLHARKRFVIGEVRAAYDLGTEIGEPFQNRGMIAGVMINGLLRVVRIVVRGHRNDRRGSHGTLRRIQGCTRGRIPQAVVMPSVQNTFAVRA